MSLLDRFLFWTAERRGFKVIELPADSDSVPRVDASLSPEIQTQKFLLQRKLEHIDTMADAYGLYVPPKGEIPHVDLR
jgi:hypothetical protein